MSVEPPIVKPPLSPEPTAKLIELQKRFGLEPTERMTVLAARPLAHQIVTDHPEVSATGAVYFDCREVEIVTPSFCDELLRLWPHVQPIGASEDVQISWDLAAERVSSSTPGGDDG